jgi:membrane associated rhomboid family serine protease
MKDRWHLLGLVLLALAAIAVMLCVKSAAIGDSESAISAGVVAALSAVAGVAWIFTARRRVYRIARQHWIREEPSGATVTADGQNRTKHGPR